MIYKIRNWSEIYENNRTRELKTLQWVPIPIKLDGDGYSYLLEECENGIGLFGAFIACVQVAGRCDPRGTLLRSSGKPHDVASLSRITRIQRSIISTMLDVCTQELKWVEIQQLTDGEEIRHPPATITHLPALKGREGKGREGKRVIAPNRPPPTRFVKPSMEQVDEYIREMGYRLFTAQKWLAHYESNGWRVGKNPMKDWKAAVRTWGTDETVSTNEAKPKAPSRVSVLSKEHDMIESHVVRALRDSGAWPTKSDDVILSAIKKLQGQEGGDVCQQQ